MEATSLPALHLQTLAGTERGAASLCFCFILTQEQALELPGNMGESIIKHKTKSFPLACFPHVILIHFRLLCPWNQDVAIYFFQEILSFCFHKVSYVYKSKVDYWLNNLIRSEIWWGRRKYCTISDIVFSYYLDIIATFTELYVRPEINHECVSAWEPEVIYMPFNHFPQHIESY